MMILRQLTGRSTKTLCAISGATPVPNRFGFLFVIIASMPTYFLILNLPVRIINEPIQGEGFDSATATLTFLDLTLSLPSFLGGASLEVFSGFELERWPYLIALSSLFLFLVCVNGLFKFYINTYKGRLGERMLRRMRYQLVDRVFAFSDQPLQARQGFRSRLHGER